MFIQWIMLSRPLKQLLSDYDRSARGIVWTLRRCDNIQALLIVNVHTPSLTEAPVLLLNKPSECLVK